MLKRITLLLLLSLVCAPLQVIAQDSVRLPTRAVSENGTATAKADAPRTLAELHGRIEQIVHQPALEPGFFAVKIVSLDTGAGHLRTGREQVCAARPRT
jgi:hypothetical protein